MPGHKLRDYPLEKGCYALHNDTGQVCRVEAIEGVGDKEEIVIVEIGATLSGHPVFISAPMAATRDQLVSLGKESDL
jgi:hypothetical protein